MRGRFRCWPEHEPWTLRPFLYGHVIRRLCRERSRSHLGKSPFTSESAALLARNERSAESVAAAGMAEGASEQAWRLYGPECPDVHDSRVADTMERVTGDRLRQRETGPAELTLRKHGRHADPMTSTTPTAPCRLPCRVVGERRGRIWPFRIPIVWRGVSWAVVGERSHGQTWGSCRQGFRGGRNSVPGGAVGADEGGGRRLA